MRRWSTDFRRLLGPPGQTTFCLGSGPGETELRERYLKQLARDEDILAGADERLAALEAERKQAQQERNALLKLVSNDSALE